ncbi:MAG: V-type ATP synthase subunit D [Candidatus Magnetoovum sp. WYHC-5]|nr:V-type ATP synthase subunit D [Candidatus Magnetoovum sp. WYHC-5]
MATVKLNKTELKRQKETLEQLNKYLPTLQLKKQQLQIELEAAALEIKAIDKQITAIIKDMEPWAALFTEYAMVDFKRALNYTAIDRESINTAGVDVPVFKAIHFPTLEYSFFITPTWVDEAIDKLRELVTFKQKRRIIEEKRSILADELRKTTIKVNLFEKRMIPQCRENIRIIKVFLGDMEIASICNAKIAKAKLTHKVRAL